MESLRQHTTEIAIQIPQKEDNCAIDLFNLMVAYPIYPWIGCQWKNHELSNNWICIRNQPESFISIYVTNKRTTFIDTMVIQDRVHIGSDRLTKSLRIIISLYFNLKSILGLCQTVLAFFDILLQRCLLFFNITKLENEHLLLVNF